MVASVQNLSWWRDNFTNTTVTIELDGHDEDGFNNSWTQQLDDPPTAWTGHQYHWDPKCRPLVLHAS